MTIKGFGLGDSRKYGPQKHGEFDEYLGDQEWKFWDERFWDERFWEAGRFFIEGRIAEIEDQVRTSGSSQIGQLGIL